MSVNTIIIKYQEIHREIKLTKNNWLKEGEAHHHEILNLSS